MLCTTDVSVKTPRSSEIVEDAVYTVVLVVDVGRNVVTCSYTVFA
jgi:hypothetical protein